MIDSRTSMRRFATRYTAAWCSQDAASVAAFYSQNGSLTINHGAPAKGRLAITQVVQSFMTSFPDLRVMMDDVSLKGQHVEYHWTLTGSNTGPGGTGRSVHICGSELWQIAEDELIASSRGQFDDVEYRRQLGSEPLHLG